MTGQISSAERGKGFEEVSSYCAQEHRILSVMRYSCCPDDWAFHSDAVKNATKHRLIDPLSCQTHLTPKRMPTLLTTQQTNKHQQNILKLQVVGDH